MDRRRSQIRAASVALALLSTFATFAESAQDLWAQRIQPLFDLHCVKCHGPDGSGLGPEGKKLGGFDFTNANEAAKESDADMAKAIRKGLFFFFQLLL